MLHLIIAYVHDVSFSCSSTCVTTNLFRDMSQLKVSLAACLLLSVFICCKADINGKFPNTAISQLSTEADLQIVPDSQEMGGAISCPIVIYLLLFLL